MMHSYKQCNYFLIKIFTSNMNAQEETNTEEKVVTASQVVDNEDNLLVSEQVAVEDKTETNKIIPDEQPMVQE